MSDGVKKMAIAKDFDQALRDIDSGAAQPVAPDTAQSLKTKIGAAYDSITVQGWNPFWNWGMFDSEVQREVTQEIGAFDNFVSDGHSEQLYFYTLKQAPRTNGAPRRILEVGSGVGIGLNFLSRIERQSEFVGVDLTPGAVARANEQYSRPGTLSYVQGDAEQLPFDDAQFDVVINVESAHNYPNLRGFLSEVSRVLRPNGYFSMVDLFTDSRLQLLERCKLESASELTWLSETEITEQVKASIRRRMAPHSWFRQLVARTYQYDAPWVARAFVERQVMNNYGKTFVEPKDDTWRDRLPWRKHASRLFNTYRHALAQKPPR